MNRGAAIFAAIVYTLDLTVIICAFTLISEALFMVLLVASVYCIGISSRTWWVPYAASAICIALAIYVRPPAAILLVPPILGMALARSPWRTVLRGAFVYVAVIVLMVTPWMIRNHVEGGHFAISSAFVYNVFYYNVPLFEAVYSHGSEYDIQDRFATELGTSNAYALGQFSYEAREAAIIRAELAHRWFAYGLYHLAASIKLFGDSSIDYGRWQLTVYGFMPTPPPGAGSWSMLLAGHWQEAIAHLFTNIPKVIERLYWLVIIIAAGYTFVIALIKRSQSSWFSLCAVLIIVVSAIVAGPLSDDPRYRLPLEPFLLLLAAPAVVMLINKVRHHLQKTFLKEL
jgi:4-amino-4-deoxy-L-arabinose transferase-like glycosyltransferase